MKFKSKIGLWFHGLHVLLAVIILVLVILFSSAESAAAGIFALLFLLAEIYVSLMLSKTYYILEENTLLIKRGPGMTLRLRYEDITGAEAAKAHGAFLTMSLDTVEIKYALGGTEKAVLVSPENKLEFLEEINKRRGGDFYGHQ